jgi:hypothetical protein
MGGLVLDLYGSEWQLVARFCDLGKATSSYMKKEGSF